MSQVIRPSIDDKVIGRHLSEARRKCGMTQKDAAGMIAVSESFLSRLERGDARICIERLFALCICYGTDIRSILDCCCKELPLVAHEDKVLQAQLPLRLLLGKSSPEMREMMFNVCEAIFQTMSKDQNT